LHEPATDQLMNEDIGGLYEKLRGVEPNIQHTGLEDEFKGNLCREEKLVLKPQQNTQRF
jgi:hypothetical protein